MINIELGHVVEERGLPERRQVLRDPLVRDGGTKLLIQPGGDNIPRGLKKRGNLLCGELVTSLDLGPGPLDSSLHRSL